MSDTHLAQLNIAKMKYPLESEQMAGFVERLGHLRRNGLSPHGFTLKQSFAPA